MLQNASDHTRESSEMEASSRQDVPSEVLQQIIYHVLAQYLDVDDKEEMVRAPARRRMNGGSQINRHTSKPSSPRCCRSSARPLRVATIRSHVSFSIPWRHFLFW